MITIALIDAGGKFKGTAKCHCDKCGCGYTWGPCKVSKIPSKDQIVSWLRRDGWSMGKEHLCFYCRKRKKKKDNVT